jgi:hypothetical protein
MNHDQRATRPMLAAVFQIDLISQLGDGQDLRGKKNPEVLWWVIWAGLHGWLLKIP